MATLFPLEPWLVINGSDVPSKKYRHASLKENAAHRPTHLEHLKTFVHEAHEDARNHLNLLAGNSLDPLGEAEVDVLLGYPDKLHLNTLKGYLGEILAGLYVQTCSPHGKSEWQVPAYLLSFHDIAFDQLWTWRETGRIPTRAPGQPGDDCLAFILDENGAITHCLVCEGKCCAGHDTGLISDAHKNISRKESRPVSLRKLIEILKQRDNEEADRWIEALQKLMWKTPSEEYQRHDLVLYVCGQHPVQRPIWLSDTEPHRDYTGGRSLESVEFHLHAIDDLIRDLYAAS